MRDTDEAKRSAFAHVIESINSESCFPAQVFRERWDAFLFFESDRVFSAQFAVRAACLLNTEGAKICCLLNYDRTDSTAYDSADMMFIDAETEPRAYDAMLRHGGGAEGWLFNMERYGCASDRGGWSIYCEKSADVAVIALRRLGDTEKYAECLKLLHARPIAALLNGSPAPVPFSQMIEPWRRSLIMNYGGNSSL